MESDRWKKVQELFEAALKREPSQRTKYLQDLCGDDSDLFHEVTSLLRADDAEHSLLDGVASDALELDKELSRVGSLIGAYKIVEQIGSGGMGTVYRAERADGGFKQLLHFFPAISYIF